MSPIRYVKGVYLWNMVFLLLAGMISPAFGGGNTASGVLDGKTFMVKQGEKGKEATDTDTLIFKDGKFHSIACDKYGFSEGGYTAKEEGDTLQFVADISSAKKGKMHWEGTVEGDIIHISYVWVDRSHWYKPNPKPVEYWAKGALKK